MVFSIILEHPTKVRTVFANLQILHPFGTFYYSADCICKFANFASFWNNLLKRGLFLQICKLYTLLDRSTTYSEDWFCKFANFISLWNILLFCGLVY